MPSVAPGMLSAERHGLEGALSLAELAWQCRLMVPLAALVQFEAALVDIQMPSIKMAFFARTHFSLLGTPLENSSEDELGLAAAAAVTGPMLEWESSAASCGGSPQLACQRGAADAAFWDNLLGSLALVVSLMTALSLGAASDAHGRRPVLLFKSLLAVVRAVCLTAAVHHRWSLWAFLLVDYVDRGLDATGVTLAVLMDLTCEHKADRAPALGLVAALYVALGCLVVPTAAALTPRTAVATATTLAVLRLLFIAVVMPETRGDHTARCPCPRGQRRGILPFKALCEGWLLLNRGALMQRLTTVMLIGAAAFAGKQVVLRPYMADIGGFGLLLPVMAPSVCLCFTSGLSRLARTFGELPSLKASVLLNLLALCLASTADYWQILLADGLLTGPALMFMPLTASIAANLVADTEQGKMQGLLVALKATATAASELIFGQLTSLIPVHEEEGDISTMGARAGLWLGIALGATAALLAARLPHDYTWGALAQKSPLSWQHPDEEDGDQDDQGDDERGFSGGRGCLQRGLGRLPPTGSDRHLEEAFPLLGEAACEEDEECAEDEESPMQRSQAESEHVRAAEVGGIRHGEEAGHSAAAASG